MIIEQVLVGPMAVFCYILGDEDSGDALLIDPASSFDKIAMIVKKLNLNVTKIVNTHGHFDHTTGNRYFSKKYGAILHIHENDAPLLKSGINRLMDLLKGGWGKGVTPQLLQDGDMITLGAERIKVIHTPGHTPGGICLYWNGNLFTGDTLFTEGFGRVDFRGGSEKDIMESIKNKILSLPDDTIIWPGHHYGRFPISTVEEQKRYYL